MQLFETRALENSIGFGFSQFKEQKVFKIPLVHF